MEQNSSIHFIHKEYNKHNCYIAEFVVDDILWVPNRTFFPADWTQEKVASKIDEAYDNFKESGITPILNRKEKYIIRGFTEENIEIEMIFTKDGDMKTAYPIID